MPRSPTVYRTPRLPSAEERRRAITEALEGKADTVYLVPFHRGYIDAPVAEIDDAFLAYRAANGRLVSELAARGLSAEQQEDAGQQQVLHELLIEKARDPSGPIYDELALHVRQTEPLLVSRDGVVVNGNRRLAAMRELRATDPEKYAPFGRVSVALLPEDMPADEIEYVEAALQMAPDLKLDYSWINRRLKLRDHVQRLDLPQADIMAAYRFDDPSMIDRELEQLAFAERYLRYRGHADRYDEIVDLEEPILAMFRELERFPNRPLSELWSYAGFAMLAERERLDADYRRYFPFVRPNPFELVHWVPRSYGEELDLFAPQPSGENRPIRGTDAELLLPIVGDPERSFHLAKRVVSLTDRLRANLEEEIGGSQILHHLRKAREGLAQSDSMPIAPAQAREIRSELRALTEFLQDTDETGETGRSVIKRLFGKG